MTSVMTRASSVIVGPSIAMPRAMLSETSRVVQLLNANLARELALDRSMSNKKKGIASLQEK